MSWPIRLTEDVYGVTDLRESLPQVVDKAAETKRPMIITKHSRPIAAIIALEELQKLYDRIQVLVNADIPSHYLYALKAIDAFSRHVAGVTPRKGDRLDYNDALLSWSVTQ